MTEHSAGPRLGRLKLLAFSLMPLTALFVCAETFATLAIHRRAYNTPGQQPGDSVYVMHIGRLPWSRTSRTPLNREGFPDDAFPPASEKGDCLHLVFSGDSFVFGDGVDRDSSFVQVTKRALLARLSDRCIRVFNLGQRGTTIRQQAQQVRETMGTLDPDLVILGQYQNDLTDLSQGTVAPGLEPQVDVRDRLRAFNLNLIRYLSYHAFGFMIQRDIEYDALRYWSVVADTAQQERAVQLMAEYEGHFARLAEELGALGIPLGVVIIPSKFDVMAGRYPEEEFFVALAEKHAIPYLRVFPILDQNRSPYAFLMYDGHLNEWGNRLVADALLEWFFESDPAPFPVLRDAR